jgi:hypothetical protein
MRSMCVRKRPGAASLLAPLCAVVVLADGWFMGPPPPLDPDETSSEAPVAVPEIVQQRFRIAPVDLPAMAPALVLPPAETTALDAAIRPPEVPLRFRTLPESTEPAGWLGHRQRRLPA